MQALTKTAGGIGNVEFRDIPEPIPGRWRLKLG